ncbi:Probable ribosome biogenesis protein RLP24 [Galdieria sulphuraria]|nr:Probable ribosome biogenesis protein RLP24 [Galdieria sulphuraria]
MKRNPRYLRWTKAYRKSHGKEMAIDSTFEFERKRQRIQRYDRELVGKTIQAIQKVDAVRVKREKDFYKSKMKQAKKQEQRTAVRELEKGINLIEPDILRVKESVRAREPVQQGVALVERDQSNTSN